MSIKLKMQPKLKQIARSHYEYIEGDKRYEVKRENRKWNASWFVLLDGEIVNDKCKTKSQAVTVLMGLLGLVETVDPKTKPEKDTVETTRFVQTPTKSTKGPKHKRFRETLAWLKIKKNVMLVGPAGSGKTHMAEQLAASLGIPFYFTGAILQKYELDGFIDGGGRLIRTPLREAVEHGGLFLWDEIDSSHPGALNSFCALLANRYHNFPDGRIDAHEDFRVIAAANTYGRGADRVYVGANQLDGRTLNRFAFVEMDYDEKMEMKLAQSRWDIPELQKLATDWCARVQAYRKAMIEHNIRHIISPRATLDGLDALEAGISVKKMESALVFQGISDFDERKIRETADKNGFRNIADIEDDSETADRITQELDL